MSVFKPYPLILTKENFWNELQEKYPAEMKEFCDWIDEYKKRVEWKNLFNGLPEEGQRGMMEPVPIRSRKFHEIPVAMQIGIFDQFMSEKTEQATSMQINIKAIENWFELRHKKIL